MQTLRTVVLQADIIAAVALREQIVLLDSVGNLSCYSHDNSAAFVCWDGISATDVVRALVNTRISNAQATGPISLAFELEIG
jgi:hypothetical protein